MYPADHTVAQVILNPAVQNQSPATKPLRAIQNHVLPFPITLQMRVISFNVKLIKL